MTSLVRIRLIIILMLQRVFKGFVNFITFNHSIKLFIRFVSFSVVSWTTMPCMRLNMRNWGKSMADSIQLAGTNEKYSLTWGKPVENLLNNWTSFVWNMLRFFSSRTLVTKIPIFDNQFLKNVFSGAPYISKLEL